jgi:type VI secretion system ImpA/VasJ family protein
MSVLLEDIAKPISDPDFSGEDIARLTPSVENKEWFQKYAQLRDLVRKTSTNSDEIVEISQDILTNKSKDLMTAGHLCRGLFHRNGFTGLAEGLEAYYTLLEQYWDKGLYPLAEPARVRTIGLLGRNLGSDIEVRKADFIPGSEVGEGDAKAKKLTPADVNALKSAAEALGNIKETVGKINGILKEKVPDGKASMGSLGQTVDGLIRTVNSGLQKAGVTAKPQAERGGAAPTQAKAEAPQRGVVFQRGEPEVAQEAVETAEVASAVAFSNDIEAIRAVIQIAKFFIEKDHKSVVPYRLVRSALWYSLPLPNPEPRKDGKKVTPIPPSPGKARLEELLKSEDWEPLVTECENVFLEGFEVGGAGCFCLDIQRFLCTALKELAQKASEGGDARGKEQYEAVQETILQETAIFVDRFPYVNEIFYSDGVTPFVDDQTKRWIEKSVKPVFGQGSTVQQGAIAQGGLSESASKISEDFEKASDLLAKQKWEEALNLMQAGINEEATCRGRFQRRLNLANLCLDAGQPTMARPLLEQLDDDIGRFSLDQWEPMLCIQVWGHLRRCYQELSPQQAQQESDGFYQEKADRIFEKLCKLDIRAALAPKTR